MENDRFGFQPGRSFSLSRVCRESGMLRNHSVRRALVLLTLSSFFSACYLQYPVTSSVPSSGTRLVALVTDTGSVLMSNAIGPGAIEVEGVVVEADAESWRLQLLRVDQRGGFSTRWNREIVAFPRYALTNVSAKVLDKKRSWTLAAILTVIVIGSTLLFGGLLGGENTDPPPPPPV